MGTSLTARTGFGLDGPTVAANDVRLQVVAGMLTGASPSGSTGIAARPGVRPGLGSPLAVTASSGMNVAVAAGICFVQNTSSTTAGLHPVCLDTAGTITLATSDVTNPRIDNIIARVVDNGDNTSTTTVERQTGTPAPSPVAPTLPATSLLLAQIAVGAGVSSIVGGNITDKRVDTAASGGIITVKTSADQPPAAADFPVYRHRLDVGTASNSPLEWSIDGSTWHPVAVIPGQVTVCTSGTRPAGPGSGQEIFETDTKRVMVWDGAAWTGVYESGGYGSWTGATLSGSFNVNVTPQYRTAPGGRIELRGTVTSNTTIVTGTQMLTGLPAPSTTRALAMGNSNQPCYLAVTAAGNGSVFNGTSSPNNTPFGLDGMSYTL